MGALDMGIVGPGLGLLSRGLGVSVAAVAWIMTIYSLVYAMAMPIQGRLADRFGRRRIFFLGIALFTTGSLLAGLSPNLPFLLASRILQAVGGGGIVPVATAELGLRAGPKKRGMAMGMVGAVFGLATILAPVVGGLILGVATWHWLFFVNVPVGIVILLLARIWVREPLTARREPLDIVGAILTLLSVLLVLLGIVAWQGRHGFEAGLLPEGLAVVLAVVLMRWEQATPHALLHPELWQRRGLPLVYLLAALTGIVMTAMLFVPLMAQRIFGVSVSTSGTSVLPMAIPAAATAALGGHLADRWGGKTALLLGLLGVGLGSWVLATGQNWTVVILGLAILGLGTGFTMGAPVNYLVFEYAPSSLVGTAIALVGVFRSIGTTLGPVLLAAFLPKFLGAARSDWRESFFRLFAVTALVGTIGLLAAFFLPRPEPTRLGPREDKALDGVG